VTEPGFALSEPATPAVLAVVRSRIAALIAEIGLDEAAARDVLLAVVEACTNVIRHAYGPDGGVLHVQAFAAVDTLVVTVRDEGSGIVPVPDPPGHWDGLGLGLGLPLIAALAAQVEIETEARSGTTLRLTFPR
jgi:serine/threonine-protein kinase RsbW